jgi:cytoskeletal protein RodZ
VGSFGDKFRKERERQSIKLEDVSNATKIGSRMLRAIEEEHFDQLPGGVFNKGFIRAYAKHLGLDEEDAVSSYLATLNKLNGHQLAPEKLAAPPGATERGPTRSGERRQVGDRRSEARRKSSADPEGEELPELQLPKAEHIRPRRKMAIHTDSGGIPWTLPALIVLAIVLGAIWWTHSRSARANGANPVPASLSPSSTTAAAIPLTDTSAASSDVAKSVSSPASSHSSSSKHPADKGLPYPGSQSGSQSSSPSSSANSADAKENTAQQEDAAEPSANPPAPKPRAKLTLVIRALENSWISVTADGQPVVHETLIAPAHTSIRAAREIVVKAGNAAGVTFALNGQEFPSAGAEGEVKTLVFDSSGMRSAAPPTTPAANAPPADPFAR